MTRHINTLVLLIILGFSISCKKENNSDIEYKEKKILSKKTVVVNDTISNGFTIWYPSAELTDVRYKNIKIYINDDSIKIIRKNQLQCMGAIVKEKLTYTDYFKSEKTGIEIKQKLVKEYDLNINDNVLAIMNSYGDISKKGCQFPFNEVFIVDNHLFFYDQGYKCFLLHKNSKSLITEKKINSLQNSDIILPYSKKINLNDVKYNTININTIDGANNFSCDGNQLRYISLPSKNTINLILVPQDCGDFPYRFYLLTLINNKVISNLYVEGEWFEPENYEEKEIKSFEISVDFVIKVSTTNNKKDKKIENYIITDQGLFKKKF